MNRPWRSPLLLCHWRKELGVLAELVYEWVQIYYCEEKEILSEWT